MNKSSKSGKWKSPPLLETLTVKLRRSRAAIISDLAWIILLEIAITPLRISRNKDISTVSEESSVIKEVLSSSVKVSISWHFES